jgi:hypothetical protein
MTDYRAATAAENVHIEKLSQDLRNIIGVYGLHPKIQADLGESGYISIDMISGCYSDIADLHKTAPGEFNFSPGDIATEALGTAIEVKFDAKTSKAERVKLGLIWSQCEVSRSKKTTILSRASSADELKGLVSSGPMDSGKAVWFRKHGEMVKVIFTGTEHFCGLIYKDLALGPIGVYGFIQRTGKLDTNLRRRMVSTRGNGGIVRDEEIEEAPIPEDFEEAKKRCYILATSIVLMVYSLPNIPHIQIKRGDIMDHYEWFWGKDLGTPTSPTPQPSLKTLMEADIAFWKKVSIAMHEGKTLLESLKKVKEDHLFWVQEVFLKTRGTSYHQPPPRNPPYNPPYNPPQKGKTKGKGKGKGKGKKGQASGNRAAPYQAKTRIPDDIAKTLASTGPASTKHPGGQPICRKHHLQFCGGWCNRVHHICPRKMGDGSYCFGHHTLRQCIERNP